MICCNIETCAFREYKYFTVYSYTYLCFLAENGPHIYEARLPKCLRLQWTCIYIYIHSFLHIYTYICIYIIYIDSERERETPQACAGSIHGKHWKRLAQPSVLSLESLRKKPLPLRCPSLQWCTPSVTSS